MAKILKEIILLAFAALAGYVLYLVYKSVKTAATATTNAANSTAAAVSSWTPLAIGKTITDDAAKAAQAITDFFSANPDAGYTGPAVTPATDYYTAAFLAGGTTIGNSVTTGLPAETAWSDVNTLSPSALFVAGGGSARVGSGAGGSW